MAIEFDPINKYIKITSGISITALEIYNAVMNWVDEQPNMSHTVPMKAIGKAPLGGGAYTDSIFILQNGWKIKLYNGTYQFTIIGTLITDDESPRTVQPDVGYVEVVFQVSSQGIQVISGSGVTQQDKVDIARLVEQSPVIAKEETIQEAKGQIEGVQSDVDDVQEQVGDVKTITERVQHTTHGRIEIDGDYLIIYEVENPDIIHKKFKLIRDAEGNIIERVPE